MARHMTRTCDARTESAIHQATSAAEVRMGDLTLVMDVCDEHLTHVTEGLRALGFAPGSMTVGHSRRAAYLTRTGRPYSTREVRTWLAARGVEVASAGRLPAGALRAYADAH